MWQQTAKILGGSIALLLRPFTAADAVDLILNDDDEPDANRTKN